MGRATDPWRAAETWIRCLASHSVPLHAATGLSAHPEVAHLPAEPSICERCDRFRRSRSATRRRPRMDHASCRRATKVRDGIPCRLIEPSSTLHPLWPYHSSNRADRRFTQRRCVPGSSAVKPSNRPPFDLASRRLSPYRSRASPGRKLAGIRELHTIIRYRAQSQAAHNSLTAIALCVCHEQSETRPKFAPKGKESLLLSGAPAAIRLSRTRL